MLGKPKLPFYVSDPLRLDQEFYTGYDELFLYRKVKILSASLDDPSLLSQFSDSEDPDDVDRFRHAIAAEILFSEFHQFECFFAILVAPFQELPHWIFLNTYQPGEIRTKARQFMERKFGELSNNVVSDRKAFLQHSIYAGYAHEDPGSEVWAATLENLWWLIYRIAEKYLHADEYNAYKHGLRIMSASSALAISHNPQDLSKAFVIRSPNSITHLKFDKFDQGTKVSIETKEFNPEESIAHVQLMSTILANIKKVRLAALTKQERVEIRLFSTLDRAALQKLAVHQKSAFSA